MKLTLEIHLVMRIKDKSNCREMKLTLEIHLVMRIKDRAIVEIKLAERHLVMRIKDCKRFNARNTSGHAY